MNLIKNSFSSSSFYFCSNDPATGFSHFYNKGLMNTCFLYGASVLLSLVVVLWIINNRINQLIKLPDYTYSPVSNRGTFLPYFWWR